MIAQIRPRDLSAWLEANSRLGRPFVLDVREPSELQTASVREGEDFTLLTIPMGSVPERLAELDPAMPYAILCHHGGRSMRVAGFLESKGFTQLANIAGGIDAWSEERDPSVPRY